VWPAIDAVRVEAWKSAVGVAIETIYTVPANKKLFIASCFISSRLSANAACYGQVIVTDSGAVVKVYPYIHEYEIAGQMATGMYYMPALEAEAGWLVKVKSSHADLIATGIIHGWLEDA